MFSQAPKDPLKRHNDKLLEMKPQMEEAMAHKKFVSHFEGNKG